MKTGVQCMVMCMDKTAVTFIPTFYKLWFLRVIPPSKRWLWSAMSLRLRISVFFASTQRLIIMVMCWYTQSHDWNINDFMHPLNDSIVHSSICKKISCDKPIIVYFGLYKYIIVIASLCSQILLHILILVLWPSCVP